MTTQQSTLIITVNARQAQQDIDRLDRSLLNLGNQGDRSVRGLGSSFSSLAGYMAGVLSVATAISKVDAYTSMQNRLKLVTASQKELNQATSDTFAIAQRTAQAWDGVVQVYQRFSENAKALGINMQQVASLTDTVSKSIAVSGASAASAEAALMQFGQALASGVLRGEEFNSIAEQAPGLLKAIATGLGVNIGELRAMANQGQLTGDVVIKSLEKAKASVDNLFSKTDFTIAQSFTQLNNATIKFVGEAGKANGAAALMSSTIASLANNLQTVANVAVLGGVGFLTKAIASQVVATQAAISATVARRASLVAEMEAQVQLAAVEVARTRNVTALALTELNLSRIEYNNALSADARAAAILRLTQAEVGYNLAVNRNTAALAAQTEVINLNNAAKSRGAMLYSALGGGIGLLTIGVVALTAGYMYMQHRTEEANQKLKEQMEVASKTKDELLKLRGVQLDVAKNDIGEAFETQNTKLRQLNNEFLGFIDNVVRSNDGNKKAAEIFELARKGTITQAQALERLNKLDVLTARQKSQGLDMVNTYMLQAQETLKAEKALNVFGIQVTLSGNKAENAAQKIAVNSGALLDNEEAAKRATQAQKDYLKSANDRIFYAEFKRLLVDKYNFSQAQAEEMAKAQEAAGGRGKKISAEMKKAAIDAASYEKKYADTIQAGKDKLKEKDKAARESEKQRKKDAKEASRDQKEQSQAEAEILFTYSSDETQARINLQKEITRLQKYGQTQYVSIAKTRYEEERKLAKMNFEYDLSEFQLTEQQKVVVKTAIREQEIKADTKLTEDQTKRKIAANIELAKQEMYDVNLAQKERIFSATEYQYSEMDRIKKRYELEREEIQKVADKKERDALLQASLGRQNKEEADVKDQAISDYQSVLGFEENPLIKQFEVLQKMRELDLINEQSYQDAKLYIQSKSMSAYMEGMFSGFASLVDENSKTYAVLFAAQKAFAVAQAVLNIPAAYSKAYDAVVGTPYVGPYIAPAIGAAAAALQVVQAAKIKSTQMTGFESGGYTGNMGTKSVAGVVHGQEYVFNATATKNIGANNLDALSKTGQLPNQQAQPTTNIINVFDESELRNAMATPSGEKIIMNVIKRNRTKLGI